MTRCMIAWQGKIFRRSLITEKRITITKSIAESTQRIALLDAQIAPKIK